MMHAPIQRILPFVLLTLFSLSFLLPTTSNLKEMKSSSPSPAANVSSNQTFPAINQQIYSNNNYNFTSNARDEASLARTWDSANLVVQQSDQVAYSNTSLAPLGTYNATYSFTSDRAGGLAEGWSYGATGTFSVVQSVLGHQKCLETTNAGAGTAYAYNTFSAAQASGNISLWVTTSNAATGSTYLVFASSAAIGKWGYCITSSLFQYYTGAGGWVSTGVAAYSNRWYYINIGFDTVTKYVYLFVDGVQIYRMTSASVWANIDKIMIGTDTATTTADYDAIDMSWQPDFSTTSRKNAYDLGRVGVYNATYSFENETMFTNAPGGFADASGAGCYARVFPHTPTAASAHHNILLLDDNSANSAVANWTFAPSGANGIVSGSVEYWVYSTISGGANWNSWGVFYGHTGYATNPFYIYTRSNNFYYYTSGEVLVQAVTVSTWYHVRVVFSCVTFTFSIYINGMLKASNVAMLNGPASLGRVAFITYDVGYEALDGLDASNDPQYYTERSTYMWLNSTSTFPVAGTMLSFPVAGAYSYKWQCWAGGIAYDSSPSPFVVLPNVQLISDGPYATNWMFISPSTTWVNVYTANFGIDAWQPDTIKNLTFYTSAIADARMNVGAPNTAYGTDGTVEWANDSLDGIRWQSVVMFPNSSFSYLMNNANISRLSVYENFQIRPPVTTHVFNTTWFDESTVTYNTRPPTGALMSTETTNAGSGWINLNFNAGINWSYYAFLLYCEPESVLSAQSREGGWAPQLHYRVPNFYNASGLIYVQTNLTETITLRSQVLPSNFSLLPNDRLTVIFNTTSQNNIGFNLRSGGSTVKEMALSEAPNYVYSTQTKQFSITREIDVDQLEFTGLFDDTNNLQITNITIDRPVGYATFDIPGVSKELDSLPLSNYSLMIFEGADLVLTQSILVDPYVLNEFSYSPTIGGQRIVNFFNPTGDVLDFYQFRCNLTRTYNNISSNFNLTTPYFYADDGSTFQLNVTDRFGNSIVNRTAIVSTFIDITLTNVYSLKIKNEMRVSTLLELTRNSITQSQYAISGEIIEYTLWNGTYQLNYTQSETGGNLSINLNVTSASYYVLNTSYYSVYVSAYSADAPDIPLSSFKLYIDGVQYFWGFNDLLADSYLFVVKDYFDANVYSAMRSISDATPINLPLSIFSFKIQNLMRNETYYTLNSPGGSLGRWLLPGTQDELFIGGGNYQLLYTQAETGTPVTYNFVITGSTRYVINSSYHTVYFSAFANDLLGIPQDSVRLYINNTRKEWGPVEILGNSHSVLVLDYFGSVQYSAIIDLSNCTEFNVFVNYAIVNLQNNYNFTAYCRISKGGVMLTNVLLQSNWTTQFRFTTGTYTIRFYYENGTHIVDSYTNDATFTLNANDSKLVSFGFFSQYYGPVPNPGDAALNWTAIGIFFGMAGSVFTFIITRARNPVEKKFGKAGKGRQIPSKLKLPTDDADPDNPAVRHELYLQGKARNKHSESRGGR